jgi:hypothetical protein
MGRMRKEVVGAYIEVLTERLLEGAKRAGLTIQRRHSTFIIPTMS